MDERNFTYMFYGFAAVWLCLVVYLVSLAAREKRIRQQLDGLKKLMEDRSEKK
jgi:CcmD family protein